MDCEYFAHFVGVALMIICSRGRSVVFRVFHRAFRAGCTMFFLVLPVEKNAFEVS